MNKVAFVFGVEHRVISGNVGAFPDWLDLFLHLAVVPVLANHVQVSS